MSAIDGLNSYQLPAPHAAHGGAPLMYWLRYTMAGCRGDTTRSRTADAERG
jgi:hypothetical protein